MRQLDSAINLMAEDLQLVMDEELSDLDITNDDPWALAQSVGITILSDKEFFAGYIDMDWEGGVIVAAAFTSLVDRTFSFDVVVHRQYQNKGLGKKLIDMCMDEYKWMHSEDTDVTLALDVVNEKLVPFIEREYGLKVQFKEGDHLIMGKVAQRGRWKTLARHRWVSNAVITESIYHDPTESADDIPIRRYTATIYGFRNFKIYEGEPGLANEIRDFVTAMRDKINEYGEDILEVVSTHIPNSYAKSKNKLVEKTKLIELITPDNAEPDVH